MANRNAQAIHRFCRENRRLALLEGRSCDRNRIGKTPHETTFSSTRRLPRAGGARRRAMNCNTRDMVRTPGGKRAGGMDGGYAGGRVLAGYAGERGQRSLDKGGLRFQRWPLMHRKSVRNPLLGHLLEKQPVVDKNRPICEPSRGGRKDGGTCRARFPSSEKSTSSYPRAAPHISTIIVHGAPIFEKKGSVSVDGHGTKMATASEVSAGASGKRARPRSPRLRAGHRQQRS